MRVVPVITSLMLFVTSVTACAGPTPTSPVHTTSTPAVGSPAAAATPSAGPSTPSASRSRPSALPAAASSKPVTTKVLTIVIENHSLSQMRTGMPYLNRLATRYGYATDYRAIRHPSLPNYLAIAFGTTAGVTDDKPPVAHHVPGPSVFSLANQAGTGARVYAESMTTSCQLTSSYPYAVRHNPWAYGSAGCARGDVPAGTPASGRMHHDVQAGTLPCAGMLIPNVVSDAHDSSLGRADSYLQSWLPTLMKGRDFRSGRLAIVVTADEDDHSSASNRVLTVVLSRSVSHRVVSAELTHYSLTRLYNAVCREPLLANARTARSMRYAFGLRISSR